MVKDILRQRLRRLKVVKEINHMGECTIDVQKAYGYPEVLSLLGYAIGRAMPPETTCIAACGYGGITPATITAQRQQKHLTLVRPLDYKGSRKIEGHTPTKKDKVTIVDDILEHGETLDYIAKAVEGNGAKVIGCVVIVNQDENNIYKGMPVKHLFRPEDLV